MATKVKWAWSHSALEAFEQCPYRFWRIKIVKDVPDPPGPAVAWGRRVHKALEDRLRSGTPLPPGIDQYEPIAARLADTAKGKTLEVEQKLALDADFLPCGYFDKRTWVRSVADVIISTADRAFLGDYKTGAVKDNPDQLALTAAMVFATKPWIKSIVSSFIWLKEDRATADRYTPDDVPAIWQRFLPRVRRVELALDKGEAGFQPKPSGLCREHCPVVSCQFNGKYLH